MLAFMEELLMATAVVCAVGIRFWGNSAEFSYYVGLREFLLQCAVFVAAFQLTFYCCNLYDLNAFRRRIEEAVAVGESIGAACLVLALIYFVFPDLLLGRGVFFISLALVAVFLVSTRFGLQGIWTRTGPAERLVILGNGNLALALAAELRERKDLNAQITAFIPAERGSGDRGADSREAIGKALAEAVHVNSASRIIVAVEDRRNTLPIRELVRLRVAGIRVEDVHSTIAALTGRIWLDAVKPSWFVFSDGFRRSRMTLVLKRAIDLAIAVVGLAISLPVMFVVAIAIRVDSGGPIIYRQMRVGLRGRSFELLKFRSMRTDAERGGARWAVDNDPRVTRVGRILRRYRLDELLQWINVISGHMSLVGPRPERPEFVKELREHISYYDERHSVRPGLTGWAQVQYRYGSSVQDAIRKLEYDLFYLKNMSTSFDVVILLKTIRIVLTGEGAK